MNDIWKKLAGLESHKVKKRKKVYPHTYAFNDAYECIGESDGVGKLADFPGATILNICHRNGKTTIILKNTLQDDSF